LVHCIGHVRPIERTKQKLPSAGSKCVADPDRDTEADCEIYTVKHQIAHSHSPFERPWNDSRIFDTE
jgi:hypothetical protein